MLVWKYCLKWSGLFSIKLPEKSYSINRVTKKWDDFIKEYFSEEIISKLLKITDASSLITVAKTSELFFCADLMRLIAYSEAICKNTEKAIDCFKTYLKNVGNQSVYKECLHILEILEDCPEKALALLNDNIQRSIIAMNLKV